MGERRRKQITQESKGRKKLRRPTKEGRKLRRKIENPSQKIRRRRRDLNKRKKQAKQSPKKKKEHLREKKIKRIKKMKKNGRVKAKGKRRKSSKQSTGSCQNVTCLNTLLQVLKIDKDTVQNFIQQKKRIDSRLSLAGKKGNKSDSTDATMKLLSASLGGTKALTKNAPICAGRYNESKGMEGVKLYKNMSECDKLIQEACDVTLPTSESAEVGKCNKVMGEFREGTETCKKTPTNCSCWIAIEKDIQGVKKCNIAKEKK